MSNRTAVLGALAIGALVAMTAGMGGPAGADAMSRTPATGQQAPAQGGMLEWVSALASGAGQSVVSGTGTIAETGRQVVEGAYYLGGEVVESGRIVGVSTLQMLGVLGVGGPQDRAGLGEQGTANAWWGTADAGADRARAAPAPHSAASGGGMAPDSGVMSPSITPVALGDAPATETAPATDGEPTAAARDGHTGDATGGDETVCGWSPEERRRPATLSGEDVATLSDLGLMDESAQRLPDGTIFLPKVTQRLLEVRTAFSCEGTVATTRRLVGHVIANPTSSGLVQAEQNGRIEGGEFGFPVIGQRVEKGELLGYLVPILSNTERADLQGEIALVRGEIAEKELMIARTRELPLLPFREGRILSMRIELAKLRAQRDALIDGLSARQPLIASVSGVIARSEVRVGQVVEERQLLWEIADTEDLWVEAESFGNQPRVAETGSTAETQDGLVMHLTLEGLGLSTGGAQSSPIQFRVDGAPEGVRIGQQVVVNVRELGQTEGVLVPRSALVRRGNGEMTVWVVKGPEQYEPRKVKWSPAGSDVVIVDAGVEAGSRVVIAGATLLSEVR